VNVLSGGGRCAVGIRQVAFSGEVEGALFVTAGSVACSRQDAVICQQFLAELDGIDLAQSIEWSDALTEAPDPDGSSGSDSGSDGSPEPDESPTTDGGGTGDGDGMTSSP
jgi:hypothetical protein